MTLLDTVRSVFPNEEFSSYKEQNWAKQQHIPYDVVRGRRSLRELTVSLGVDWAEVKWQGDPIRCSPNDLVEVLQEHQVKIIEQARALFAAASPDAAPREEEVADSLEG